MSSTAEQPETTDRIEKRLDVAAPRARVWRALSDATEFGTWFGISKWRAARTSNQICCKNWSGSAIPSKHSAAIPPSLSMPWTR